MSDEIARLGVAVDSTGAVKAASDIDKLAASGDRATKSTHDLKQAWDTARFSPTQLYGANQNLKAFQAAAAAARVETTKLDDSWKKQTFSPNQLFAANRALNSYKASLEQGSQAADVQVKSNTVLAASHHQVAKAAAGYQKSAKELAFATRNLPAQFTDIAVSLQAGQNPMTVLLQQGGQLKDMFGGVGPAVKAMGGYVLGLINPLSVAAVGTLALAVAWAKGDAEGRKFAATLELQGNSLGVSTGDLQSAASAMERFGQTQGKSAAALNQTAATGKIFGDSIQKVTQAALDLEREGGVAIEDTIKDFVKLADEPVEAAVKLDEQYKFLTVSTYNQIRALQEQGDTMGASRLAMDELADTISTRAANIEENLGTLEKTWRLVANSAKWAWDQMLNIGRESSVTDRIVELNDKIREVSNPSNMFSYAHLGPKGSDQRQAYVKQMQDEIRQLQVVLNKETADAEKKFQEEQARVATISLAEEARRGQSNAQKRVTERARIEAQVTKAIGGIVAKSEADRLAQEQEIRKNADASLAAMEKRLADPKEPKAKKSEAARDAERLLNERARQYENLDRALDSYEEKLKATGQAEDSLSEFQRASIKILSDLDNGHIKLDASQQKEIRARIQSLSLIDEENQKREKQNRIMQVSADLAASLAEQESRQSNRHADELRGMGRGRNEAAAEAAMEDIRRNAALEKIDLAERYGELNAKNSAEYLRDLARIEEAERRMIAAEKDHMKNRIASMRDWRGGVRSALEDLKWVILDTSGQTRDSVMTIYGAMQNALSQFAATGKVKMRDFATVVIAELLRIALTIAANKILSYFFGGGSTGSSAGASGGGGTPSFVFPSANGNIFGVGGGVHTSATLIPMANGKGLIAENQPEAVMPLRRTANGRLGVEASGGGGGGPVNITTNVVINQDGSSNSSTKSDKESDAQSRRLGDMINIRILEVLRKERLQGGILWGMVHGR